MHKTNSFSPPNSCLYLYARACSYTIISEVKISEINPVTVKIILEISEDNETLSIKLSGNVIFKSEFQYKKKNRQSPNSQC